MDIGEGDKEEARDHGEIGDLYLSSSIMLFLLFSPVQSPNNTGSAFLHNNTYLIFQPFDLYCVCNSFVLPALCFGK